MLGPTTATDTPAPAASPGPSGIPELVVAGPDEPGRPLRIGGRVLDGIDGQPIPDASIVLYQADDDGEYEPTDPADESSARLRGELTSDHEGRFAFRTVLPGEYPDQPPGNRHIHVPSVRAAGYVPVGFVILFDHNVRDEVRAWAQSTGFGRVIETTLDDGVLRGSLDIRLEPLVAEASAEP